MESPKRYHPALVTLHWLTAVLVFVNLFLGMIVFEDRSLDFDVLGPYVAVHMAVGVSLIVLLVIRFFVRIKTSKPADASSDNKFLDLLAKLVHYGLYLTVLVVTLLGLVFSVQTGRFQSTFLGAESRFGPPPGGFQAQGTPGIQQPAPPANGGAGAVPGGAPGFQGGPGGPGGRPGGMFSLLRLHQLAAYLLLTLVSLHILAAVYHQFIRKDNLLARMGYGERV